MGGNRSRESQKGVFDAITVASMMTAPAFLFADQDGRRADVMENPETVREMQHLLNQRGFDAGDVDGQWGSKTSSALTSKLNAA